MIPALVMWAFVLSLFVYMAVVVGLFTLAGIKLVADCLSDWLGRLFEKFGIYN